MSKQTTHRFYMERFSLKKLNEVEVKEKYRVAYLEDLGVEVGVTRNKAWETSR
jgi:hypothetical protein